MRLKLSPHNPGRRYYTISPRGTQPRRLLRNPFCIRGLRPVARMLHPSSPDRSVSWTRSPLLTNTVAKSLGRELRRPRRRYPRLQPEPPLRNRSEAGTFIHPKPTGAAGFREGRNPPLPSASPLQDEPTLLLLWGHKLGIPRRHRHSRASMMHARGHTPALHRPDRGDSNA